MEYKKFLQDYKYLERLEELHERKVKLRKQITSIEVHDPFIIEFSGLPRTGKTVTSDRIYEFFKFGDFNIEKTTEPAAIIKRTHTPEELKHFSSVDFNDETLRISREELVNKKEKKPDIIIQDRGIIDNYFWYQMMLMKGQLSEDEFADKISNLYIDLQTINQLYVFKADPATIVLRDYMNEIYLEDRKKTTIEQVSKLRDGIDRFLPAIEKNIPNGIDLFYYDTTCYTEMDTSIAVANSIIDGMEKQIVKVKK